MTSTSRQPLDTLEKDLPTTPADVEALRRAARHRPADPFAAVQALVDSLPPQSRKARRETHEGREELVLPGDG